MASLWHLLGPPVTDAEEEAFLVFSHTFPSQTLGFLDPKASTLDLTVAGRDLTIHQSRGLLTSDRKEGTTGAVVWKVTPLFAEWIASPNFLSQHGYLTSSTIAVELGAGVSGIVALSLSPQIKKYVATDQDYVLRLLRQNITENLPAVTPKASKKRTTRHKKDRGSDGLLSPNIETFALDWETDSVVGLTSLLKEGQTGDETTVGGVDLVIACDCIYNDALIEPLNSTCAQICRLRPESHDKPTLCLIAQQLRSPEIFESWLASFNRYFHVYRVPDALITESFSEKSGLVVHVGVLR
ncbi:hypothetical protein EJ04DRAFT_564147 [Polyplosphaeria fusca]|uniref:Diaminohydroxyphosphoribosylamino-pyrimidine deaminase n=1 Tax=Polyplosphaeria fusca TaxID=682080 RepID=A0A9P4R0J2_9PLEO|nr:hypothetical protein EJ04DRAFT_564147 [Polyplosphaeria fusca]